MTEDIDKAVVCFAACHYELSSVAFGQIPFALVIVIIVHFFAENFGCNRCEKSQFIGFMFIILLRKFHHLIKIHFTKVWWCTYLVVVTESMNKLVTVDVSILY